MLARCLTVLLLGAALTAWAQDNAKADTAAQKKSAETKPAQTAKQQDKDKDKKSASAGKPWNSGTTRGRPARRPMNWP